MKKLTLTLCAVTALVSAAYAGTETYSSKDSKQMPPPCPQWYADTEWNIGISGVYAPFTDREDFQSDDAWGGAMDIKYFFHRYFGVGVQGFGLALGDNDNNRFRNNNGADWGGGVLGTFTFRYPIPCSRFAPYAWVGAGAAWAGNDNDFNDRLFNNHNDDARFVGQGGVGFEVRFTPHFGWTNDVSYNYLDGSHNDFFQVRTGLNFAF